MTATLMIARSAWMLAAHFCEPRETAEMEGGAA